VKFDLDLRHHSALTRPHLETNQPIGDCSISLKFRIDFDHLTFDKTRIINVTASNNVSASKRYNSGMGRLMKSKLGENYTRVQRNTRHMFKVIRSNTEIAITPPRTVRLRSNLVESFITSQATRCKCSRSKLKVIA